MTAEYMIDAIGPFPVQPGTEITARAWAILLPILVDDGWIARVDLPDLILRAVSEIGPLPECQRPMYVTQFCNNLKGSETTT